MFIDFMNGSLGASNSEGCQPVTLSGKGGLHRPPQTADHRTEREQPRVDHAREVAECKAEGGTPF